MQLSSNQNLLHVHDNIWHLATPSTLKRQSLTKSWSLRMQPKIQIAEACSVNVFKTRGGSIQPVAGNTLQTDTDIQAACLSQQQ